MTYLLQVYTVAAACLLVFCTACASKAADTTKNGPSSQSVNQYSDTRIQDEIDKTDIFAIPLDESEIGEDADRKLKEELQAEKKAQQEKKATVK